MQLDLAIGEPPVFVDDLLPCLPTANWRFDKSCHLFVSPETDLAVLHAFAAKIGLRRSWFQSVAGKMPHYDLNESKRSQAKRCGATYLTRNDTVSVIRAWRALATK
jgi:hypothetical protein